MSQRYHSLSSGQPWAPALRDQVRRQLAASLRNHGLGLCPASDAGEAGEVRGAVAHVELSAGQLSRVTVSIELQGEVTEKRLSRVVDLGEFSGDSHAVALAVSADELLRASRIELADTPPPTRPPAPEATPAVGQEPSRARPARLELGAVFTARAYSEGLILLGTDLPIGYWVTDVVGLELSVGAALGLRQHSDHGTIRTRALGVAPALLVRLWSAGPLTLLLRGEGRVEHLRYEGKPAPGAEGRTDSDFAASTSLSAVARVAAGPVWLRLELGGGGALREVGAADEGERAVALGGTELRARAGLGVSL